MLRHLKNLSELVVFEHTIFSSAFILIAMVVAAKGWFGFGILLLCSLALISARNFAMAINRYVDIDIIHVQNLAQMQMGESHLLRF